MLVTMKLSNVEVNDVKIGEFSVEACYSSEEFTEMMETYVQLVPKLLEFVRA